MSAESVWLLHVDPARELADVACATFTDAPGGPVPGSGWQPQPDEATARAKLAELIASGYRRGHWNAPTF